MSFESVGSRVPRFPHHQNRLCPSTAGKKPRIRVQTSSWRCLVDQPVPPAGRHLGSLTTNQDLCKPYLTVDLKPGIIAKYMYVSTSANPAAERTAALNQPSYQLTHGPGPAPYQVSTPSRRSGRHQEDLDSPPASDTTVETCRRSILPA